MPNLRIESERARRTTGHPFYKNERQALIQIAKTWPGHRGVNFATTTSENIYLLIMDSRKAPLTTDTKVSKEELKRESHHLMARCRGVLRDLGVRKSS